MARNKKNTQQMLQIIIFFFCILDIASNLSDCVLQFAELWKQIFYRNAHNIAPLLKAITLIFLISRFRWRHRV